VPVGAYLSGGLDSSTITALVRNYTSNYLRTFSIAFADPAFDEREHQERMVEFLGTDHRRVECADADVGRVFPDVIWHTEWPILRTSPAPMFLLSQLVRQNNIKVVLTGEGADEFLGGYNIFKEAKLRRFWARDPDSAMRPLLLKRLYPYVPGLGQGGTFLEAFFRKSLTDTERLDYSHAIRWANTAPLRRFGRRWPRHSILRSPSLCQSTCSHPRATGCWRPIRWRDVSLSWTTASSNLPAASRHGSRSTD
jgi:asparagine synthase (glutamine-hydrolysing)